MTTRRNLLRGFAGIGSAPLIIGAVFDPVRDHPIETARGMPPEGMVCAECDPEIRFFPQMTSDTLGMSRLDIGDIRVAGQRVSRPMMAGSGWVAETIEEEEDGIRFTVPCPQCFSNPLLRVRHGMVECDVLSRDDERRVKRTIIL